MLEPFEWFGMNLFEILILVVTGFIVARILFWLLVQVPSGHTKDEAICEKCLGKKMEDEVTKPLEWCDCPLRETSDKHEHHHNDCPDCQSGVNCTVCPLCASWLHGEEK